MLPYYNIGTKAIYLYDFFNYLSIAVLIVWVLTQAGTFTKVCPHAFKQKTNTRKWIVAAVEFIVMTYCGVGLLLVLNPRFGDWFTDGNANYYGSLTAYFIAFTVVSAVLGISPLRSLDLLAPGLPLSLVVSKIACVTSGCCSSFEMPGSFYYNMDTGRYEFPIQMVEAAVALLLFFFMLWYRKRARVSGELFPVYLISYSVTRFFLEFLRADIAKIHGSIDSYHVMSVLYALLGIALLFFVKLKGDSINGWFDLKTDAEGKRAAASAKQSKGSNKNKKSGGEGRGKKK